MPSISPKYTPVLLEAIEELMYKISLRLEALKGGPMTEERRDLTKKQRQLEDLQHLLLESSASDQVDEL